MARTKKHPALQPGNWVLIHWDDACANNSAAWTQPDGITPESHGTAACLTAGRVIFRNSKQVILAQSSGPGAVETVEAGNTWAIPLGMITKVQRLPVES